MSQVTFYLMSEPDDAQASAVERLACQLAADGWSAGHLYLFCNDEAQALRMADDPLWSGPDDGTILAGTAPVDPNLAPIDI